MKWQLKGKKEFQREFSTLLNFFLSLSEKSFGMLRAVRVRVEEQSYHHRLRGEEKREN